MDCLGFPASHSADSVPFIRSHTHTHAHTQRSQPHQTHKWGDEEDCRSWWIHIRQSLTQNWRMQIMLGPKGSLWIVFPLVLFSHRSSVSSQQLRARTLTPDYLDWNPTTLLSSCMTSMWNENTNRAAKIKGVSTCNAPRNVPGIQYAEKCLLLLILQFLLLFYYRWGRWGLENDLLHSFILLDSYSNTT